MDKRIQELYSQHETMPYLSPERDIERWLLEGKPVPKRNMQPLRDGLLAGDIILLWLVSHGTFMTGHWFPKYFEYTYGIDAPRHLKQLVADGYVYVETAFESLDHVTATTKKRLLKNKGVSGLSKMKVADLDQALRDFFTEEELGVGFEVRGYALTEKGQQTLQDYPDVVARHPKKK